MLENDGINQLFRNKKILVTGGLGSIGSEIVAQLLRYDPAQIRIMDNRETELFYVRNEYADNSKVEILFGDIRDKERLHKAISGFDIIFHAAAMKHVILCEYDPFEAVKTNVIGTQNIIECAIDQNVERVVLISTDKVVNPTNVMGATKLLAERLVSAMCNTSGKKNTKFGIVRFGNVLASRGSVLEIWERQLKYGQKITITNPEMTRFFMSIPESVNLVFNASYFAENGETFILKMPSIKIKDLAESFLDYQNKPENYFEIIGMKPGEKMHESLLFTDESELLLENKHLYVRLPLILDNSKTTENLNIKGFKKSAKKEISSDNKNCLLDKKQIQSVLKSIQIL